MHKVAITAIVVHASCWLLPADAQKNVTAPAPVESQSTMSVTARAPAVPQSSKSVKAGGPIVSQSSKSVTAGGPVVSQSSKDETLPAPVVQQTSKSLPAAASAVLSSSKKKWTAADPYFPKSGIKIADFVSKNWRIHREALGDLNGDGLKDAVVLCIRKRSNPDRTLVPVPAVLFVLFADRHGYQNKCIIQIADINGGDSTLQLEEVKIDRGNIVITLGNSSIQIFNIDFKWRWQNGNFELIRITEMHGNVREGTSYAQDYNLNTGYTQSYGSTNALAAGSEPTMLPNSSYYTLRAGAVTSVPDMNRKILPAAMPGQSIKLARSVNVVGGIRSWKGPSDFSAVVSAVHDDKVLFVSALVTEKTPDKFTSLRLTDEANHHILANALVTPSKHGVLIEARFLLSQLDSAMEKHTQQPRDSKVYRLSLEVVKPKSDTAPEMVLSTSCSAKSTGEIHLTRTTALPHLNDWDWQKRDD